MRMIVKDIAPTATSAIIFLDKTLRCILISCPENKPYRSKTGSCYGSLADANEDLDNEKENLVALDIDVNKKNPKMNIIEMIGRNGGHKTFIVDDLKMKEIELIARNLKKVDKNQRL